MNRASITGWGRALPSRELANAELASRLGVSGEWISQRTGIDSRRIVSEGETTSSLAVGACREALARAGNAPDDIDMVIVATSTPDYLLPATASLVQAELGCRNAGAFDLNAACSGFLYGLAQATSLIESGLCRRVLLCGADTLSRVADYDDARSCVLFGDGAGAVVIDRAMGVGGLGPFVLRSDGADVDLLYVGSDERLIRMQGREVYRRAVEAMSQALVELAATAGVSIDELDLVIAHQANARILEAVAARVGLAPGKLVVNIAQLGNTSAASIPLALSEVADRGEIREGDLVGVTAFGAGFTWGAGLVSWGPVARPSRRPYRMPELVGTVGCLGEPT